LSVEIEHKRVSSGKYFTTERFWRTTGGDFPVASKELDMADARLFPALVKIFT
jgi:hypothetical protein